LRKPNIRSGINMVKKNNIGIIFIDYSETYYMNVAKTALPESRAGKFVQIRKKATEYLVFSPKEFAPYHADLVGRFCSDKGIKGSYSDEGKRFNIHNTAWAVIGGGRFEMNIAKRYIRLYDNSMAYGRFDPAGLKEKILSVDELSGYDVKIE